MPPIQNTVWMELCEYQSVLVPRLHIFIPLCAFALPCFALFCADWISFAIVPSLRLVRSSNLVKVCGVGPPLQKTLPTARPPPRSPPHALHLMLAKQPPTQQQHPHTNSRAAQHSAQSQGSMWPEAPIPGCAASRHHPIGADASWGGGDATSGWHSCGHQCSG